MPNAHMCSWGTISSRNTSAPSRHHGRTEKTTTTTNPYGYNKQMQSLLRSVTQSSRTHLHTHTRTQYTRTHETHKHLVGTETTSEILCRHFILYTYKGTICSRAVLRFGAFFPKNIFSLVETVAGVESRALGFRYMCVCIICLVLLFSSE